MKVKDLIKDTIWIPSRDYDSIRPHISVLMPTYSREECGLFTQSVNAILGQTFENFELIIVDDASTDGTYDVIMQLMKKDKRISCLLHPKNIGLPAISEYEAFMKARGEYIIFAFDDFIFEKNAFQILYDSVCESGYFFCHGLIRLFYIDRKNKKDFVLLGGSSAEGIYANNSIANASVIVKKDVLLKIGLYDPHIIIARVCDWDLWRRIAAQFAIKKINVIIGSEYGVTQYNSIGNTYHYDLDFVQEYMSLDRNFVLRPEQYSEFEIDSQSSLLDPTTNLYIKELVSFYSDKSWYQNSEKNRPIKIIFYGYMTSYFLCFAFLNSVSHLYQIKIHIPIGKYNDALRLKRADIVIVERDYLENLSELWDIVRSFNIKWFYFIDDNFTLLRNEYPKSTFSWFTHENIKHALAHMEGVLTSTPALGQYYLENKLHHNVFVHGPVLCDALLNSIPVYANKLPLHIAIVGGVFRKASFINHVIPALNKINKEIPVKLFIRKDLLDPNLKTAFQCVDINFTANYSQFIHELRHHKVNIIIHPAGETANLDYKTNAILLTALYCGANIIVCNEPAFADVNLNEGVVKANNTISGILEALRFILSDNQSKILKQKLSSYCAKEFSPAKRVKVLDKVFASVKRISYPDYQNNFNVLVKYLTSKVIDLERELPSYAISLAVQHTLLKLERVIKRFRLHRITAAISLCKQKLINNFVMHYYTNHDFSASIQPQFIPLLSYSCNNNLKKTNYFLRVSNPINIKGYREYSLIINQPSFSEIAIAAEPTPARVGCIGIEVVLPNGQIGAHAVQNLELIDFHFPLVFQFPEIKLKPNSQIYVRIFCRHTTHPISIYEFRKKGWHTSKHKQLFCEVN